MQFWDVNKDFWGQKILELKEKKLHSDFPHHKVQNLIRRENWNKKCNVMNDDDRYDNS